MSCENTPISDCYPGVSSGSSGFGSGSKTGLGSGSKTGSGSKATSSGAKSVPAILGGRKRKGDYENTDTSSRSSPLDCLMAEEESLDFLDAFLPTNSSVSSSPRVPLAPIRDSNNRLAVLGSNRGSKPKSSSPARVASSSSLAPPPAKKIKMRQSWAQFREFIYTSSTPMTPTTGCTLLPASPSPFPTLNWADRQEMWDLICKKETGMYLRKSCQTVLAQHPGMQPRMRAILLDWLVEVCEVYRLHRETFYLAVDFIDRYLGFTKEMPKNRLQLIGVSCLFIGSKIEEIYPPKLSEFAYVTDGACTEKDILDMELVILKELNWGLSPMTPNSWMKLFMQVANTCPQMSDHSVSFVLPQFSGLPFSRAMQLLDLVTMDMGSMSFAYSVLAATALAHTQGKQLALSASGFQWTDISRCYTWMSSFALALREDHPVPLQPKSFHNITVDDQHNIQTHTVDLKTMDRAQEKLNRITSMTPDSSPDNSIVRLEKSPYGIILPVEVNNRFNSVFLTPETPNNPERSELGKQKGKPVNFAAILLNN